MGQGCSLVRNSRCKRYWLVPELGGAGSQRITRLRQVLLASLMETQIRCPPVPVGLVGVGLSKLTMVPASTSVPARATHSSPCPESRQSGSFLYVTGTF